MISRVRFSNCMFFFIHTYIYNRYIYALDERLYVRDERIRFVIKRRRRSTRLLLLVLRNIYCINCFLFLSHSNCIGTVLRYILQTCVVCARDTCEVCTKACYLTTDIIKCTFTSQSCIGSVSSTD